MLNRRVLVSRSHISLRNARRRVIDAPGCITCDDAWNFDLGCWIRYEGHSLKAHQLVRMCKEKRLCSRKQTLYFVDCERVCTGSWRARRERDARCRWLMFLRLTFSPESCARITYKRFRSPRVSRI